MSIDDFKVQMPALTVHYNVVEHYINVDDFITAAASAKRIVEELNLKLFGGKLKYEIVVLPPLPGTLKERLGIKVYQGAMIALLASVGPEITSGVVKGLTDRSIAEWSELVARETKLAVADLPRVLDEKLTALFLAEATKGFLEQDTNNLKKFGITPSVFPVSFDAKNKFYESCYRNRDIHGLGFDDKHEFPIQRKDFPRYIAEIKEKEDEQNGSWEWEITYISVISPNWDKNDTKREWKAQYADNKRAFFTVEDDKFWALFESGRLVLKGKDSIKVQWTFIRDGARRKRVRVLRVLEYNGNILSDPLTDEDLKRILGEYKKTEEGQGELFE